MQRIGPVRNLEIASSPEMPNGQIGAVSFIQNFGATLNVHPHFHLIVADGVFYVEGEELQFHEAIFTEDDIRDTQERIQERVLRFFGKRGWFTNEVIEKMLTYENSGFSLDASVRIHSWDSEGLERLIRYCARPCFASENLRWNGPWLVYRLSKPNHKGQVSIQLEPLEFLDRIAALIPFPRRHRRHYHGVFAPNAPLRKEVVANARRRLDQRTPASMQQTVEKTKRASLDWAQLIARIYEVNPLQCINCGKKIKIIYFVTHAAEIQRILRGIGWSNKSHEFDPAYDLSNWDICQLNPETEDGFPVIEAQVHCDIGPDPPSPDSYCDPPFSEDNCDPPHWSD